MKYLAPVLMKNEYSYPSKRQYKSANFTQIKGPGDQWYVIQHEIRQWWVLLHVRHTIVHNDHNVGSDYCRKHEIPEYVNSTNPDIVQVDWFIDWLSSIKSIKRSTDPFAIDWLIDHDSSYSIKQSTPHPNAMTARPISGFNGGNLRCCGGYLSVTGGESTLFVSASSVSELDEDTPLRANEAYPLTTGTSPFPLLPLASSFTGSPGLEISTLAIVVDFKSWIAPARRFMMPNLVMHRGASCRSCSLILSKQNPSISCVLKSSRTAGAKFCLSSHFSTSPTVHESTATSTNPMGTRSMIEQT